ncbi:hypothetical protein ES702_07400 [subsurface metagenome]
MYLKVITTKNGKKTYRYVRLIRAVWAGGQSLERTVATLGTLDEVLKSRDTIIRGLQTLSTESPARSSGQKQGSSKDQQRRARVRTCIRTKGDARLRRRRLKAKKKPPYKSRTYNKRLRSKPGRTPDKKSGQLSPAERLAMPKPSRQKRRPGLHVSRKRIDEYIAQNL